MAVVEQSKKLREEALRLLKRRAQRLSTLLDGELPTIDVLIVNEARLISRAAMMLDLHAWQSAERDDLLRQWKTGLGVCTEEDCDEYVQRSREQETRDRPLGELFAGEYCPQHAAQHISELIMDDVTEAEWEEDE